MKTMKILSAALILNLAVAGGCLAAESCSGRAVAESGKAGSHGGTSALNGIAASGQATSAAVAVPFAVSGAAGSLGHASGSVLTDASTAPAGSPLPVAEETVTAGAPPDQALKAKPGARP